MYCAYRFFLRCRYCRYFPSVCGVPYFLIFFTDVFQKVEALIFFLKSIHQFYFIVKCFCVLRNLGLPKVLRIFFFIVLAFTCMSVIHFEFICICDIKKGRLFKVTQPECFLANIL